MYNYAHVKEATMKIKYNVGEWVNTEGMTAQELYEYKLARQISLIRRIEEALKDKEK
tara:strand:- start:510 stop:680 length:171 start_codon:yes stop_codon:yes gene_type:complete